MCTKVIVAIDSLKGCLSWNEAGNIIKDGIIAVYRNAQVTVLPLADGGEGTVEALIDGMGGTLETLLVTGPLNQRHVTEYYLYYGPQKGATPKIIEELDKGLINFDKVVKRVLNKDIAQVAGVGAAGGLGYSFLAFFNAKLLPGIDIVMKEINLETHIKDADFVITGEGVLITKRPWGRHQ